MPARFLVLVLRVRDVEQDLLDFAALVRAQLVELQRADLLPGPGIVLHVQKLDGFVEDLAGLLRRCRRRRGRRRSPPRPSRAPARLVPSCDAFWPLPGAWPRAVAPSDRLTASASPVRTKRNDPLACCSMASLQLLSDESVERQLLLELEANDRLNTDALDRDAAVDLRVVAPARDRLQRRVVEDVLRLGVDDDRRP